MVRKKEISLLLVLFLAIIIPELDATYLKSPYPTMYPHDIGDIREMSHYFQYYPAQMAFTKVYQHEHEGFKGFGLKDPKSPIDIGAVLYRTHVRKQVWFQFQPGSMTKDRFAQFIDLYKPNNHPYNILGFPLVKGPSGKGPMDISMFGFEDLSFK